jgi:hypothetical protein
MKIFPTFFLILVLTSCSINAGNSNNSSRIATPTALAALSATPTTLTATPTANQIVIPATCLQYADTSEWSAQVESSCITTQTREEIIEILVTVWLTQFTSTNVSEDIRIEKFTIDSVKIDDSQNLPASYKADYIAALTYSVKPTIASSSRWIAGDGMVGNDGWVRSKRNYVGIINTGNAIEIKIWGYYQA